MNMYGTAGTTKKVILARVKHTLKSLSMCVSGQHKWNIHRRRLTESSYNSILDLKKSSIWQIVGPAGLKVYWQPQQQQLTDIAACSSASAYPYMGKSIVGSKRARE